MKRHLLIIAATTFFACGSVNADLTITSIFDGSGDTPRGIELFVGATRSFENWSVELEFNANTDPLADEFGIGHVFDSTVYNEGDFIYVTSTPTDSTLTATSSAIISASALNVNGDDRVRISDDLGSVVDQYGVSGLDGTGQDWEYTGSFAYRNDFQRATSSFSVEDWLVAPVNSLENDGNASLSNFLGTFSAVPEPSSVVLFGVLALGIGSRRRRV